MRVLREFRAQTPAKGHTVNMNHTHDRFTNALIVKDRTYGINSGHCAEMVYFQPVERRSRVAKVARPLRTDGGKPGDSRSILRTFYAQGFRLAVAR